MTGLGRDDSKEIRQDALLDGTAQMLEDSQVRSLAKKTFGSTLTGRAMRLPAVL